MKFKSNLLIRNTDTGLKKHTDLVENNDTKTSTDLHAS